jgi:hypothetical protein
MPIQLDGTTGISTTGNIISNGTITATNIALNNINTPGNISAAGNITAGGALTVGSFAATTLSATGNVTGGNLVTAGAISAASVSASGNITGGNVNAAGLSLSGNVVSAINSTSAITTTANVSANYFIGNGAALTGFDTSFINSGNSNVKVYTNANVATSVNGVANVLVVTDTGLNITGTVSANGNVTGGNVLTGGLISATGNITGSYFLGNGSQLTGIDATSIQNGTSNVRVVSSGGNVTVGIGGTSNVAVFATTGEYVTGEISASGNVTGGNLVTAGAISAASVSASGNITAGNIITSGASGNISGANVISGTTFSASANITGGNILTGGLISATANVNGGNLISAALVQGVTVSASGNVIGGNVNTNTLTGTGTTIGSTGNINLSASGNIVLSTQTYINNLSTPVQNNDAATKQYVDDIAQGLHTHDSCNAATTTTLATISSGTVTYNNGTSGVGATLTTTGTYTTIDGVTLSNGMRILVKNEVDSARNGIYDRTSTTVLTRSTDFDTPTEMAGGDFTFVTAGTLYDNTGWVMTEPVTTVGTSPVPWVQFSGAGTYTAGTGLTLTGSEFSVNASQTQITTVGTLGALAVTANITGGNLLTGGLISATGTITGANITGSNILTAGLISATGTITGANITGANILTGGLISATGAITGAAITGTSLTVSTGNITAGNLLISGAIIDSAQLDIQTSAGNANIVLTPNGTGNVNTVRISASGNVTAATYFGSGAGLTSIPGANVTGTVPSATTAGTVTTAAQGNITSVGTLTGLTINNATTAITNGATAGTGNIGASGAGFNTIFAKATSAQYADLAEKYSADADYAPGTVLVFGGDREVTVSNTASDHRIAGVVSTNPAHLMNSELDCEYPVAIALTGRTPTRVTGLIHKGDLMISAGNGAAMACATPVVGTVIGKALENFDGESGVIEVVVGVR